MRGSARQKEKEGRTPITARRSSTGPKRAISASTKPQPPTNTKVNPSRTHNTVTSAHQATSAIKGQRPSFERAAVQSSTQPDTVEPTYPALEITTWLIIPGTNRE